MKKIIFILCGLLLVACTKESGNDPIKTDPVVTKYVDEVVARPNVNANNIGKNEVLQNVAFTVTATPMTGYVFDTVLLDGVLIPTTENTTTISYTFENASHKVEFSAKRPMNWDLIQNSWVTSYMKNRLVGGTNWLRWYPPSLRSEVETFSSSYDLREYDLSGVLIGGGKYSMPSKDSLIYGQTRYGINVTKDTLKMNYIILAYFVGGKRDPAHDTEQTEILVPQK